jgi:hypothetical protein
MERGNVHHPRPVFEIWGGHDIDALARAFMRQFANKTTDDSTNAG